MSTMSGARLAGRQYGRVAIMLAVSAVVTLAAGCGTGLHHRRPSPSRRRTPPPPAPSGPGRPGRAPSQPQRSRERAPREPTPTAPVFQASTSVLTERIRARMTGASWRPGCPVGLRQLRLLTLSCWGFDHSAHTAPAAVPAAATRSSTSQPSWELVPGLAQDQLRRRRRIAVHLRRLRRITSLDPRRTRRCQRPRPPAPPDWPGPGASVTLRVPAAPLCFTCRATARGSPGWWQCCRWPW
jgi:hypothetical protein